MTRGAARVLLQTEVRVGSGRRLEQVVLLSPLRDQSTTGARQTAPSGPGDAARPLVGSQVKVRGRDGYRRRSSAGGGTDQGQVGQRKGRMGIDVAAPL